jgi:ABC-2 type transport system ATP-binding protein
MNDAIQLNQVSFSLAKKKILDRVDFKLAAGRALGLIGHNGAGKTTLFHLILGLKFPRVGTINLFGESNLDYRSRRRLGYVPERPYLNLEDTLHDALKFSGTCFQLSSAELAARLPPVIQQVGLEKNRDQKLKSFSKGMLQRTLIAQALIANPDLLILDEPMSGLDPEGRAFIRELMLELKRAQKTILFSSHALEDIDLIADEVLILDQGRQTFHGSIADWKANAGRVK